MENAPAEQLRAADRAPAAIRAAGVHPCSFRRPVGAALDYDLEKETEGFRLDHTDAAIAASW